MTLFHVRTAAAACFLLTVRSVWGLEAHQDRQYSFDDFVQEFSKVYDSDEERQLRKEIFNANLVTIRSHNSANAAVNGMLGGQLDVHDAMIALQRADLTLQFGVQVRNKLVSAYHDVMNMQV